MTFERPRRRVERVFLHCSASDDVSLSGDKLVETVRHWHWARGFSNVGYHFLIDKQGAVLPGRGLEKTPAAQKGRNTGTVSVVAFTKEAACIDRAGQCVDIRECMTVLS